jgi:DNA helicase IV
MGWKAFPWPFGYVVVYPQGEITNGGFNTFDASTIVLRRQLPGLAKSIRSALNARGTMENRQPLNGDKSSEIGEVLMNHPLEIGPADSLEDVVEDRDTIEVLTRQQHAALRGIFLHPSVAVTGPAGSGKTVLAVWRLRALVEQGEQALFLCFNKMLATHLRLQNSDLAEHIWHADSYFARLVGPRPSVPKREMDEYYSETLPGLVIDLVETRGSNKLAVDALIVDEGQDFGEYRLWAARNLVRPGGTFVYCSDDRQDLYDRRVREAVGAEVVFSLLHNCRNTVRINETGNRVLDEHVKPMPGLPEGVDTVVEHIADRRAMAKAAWRHAASWAGRGVRVAILSPFTLEKSSMASARKGHNLSLVTELAEWNDTTVMFSTVRSFKGLEADAVVLIDAPEPTGPPLDRRDLYVATTRARTRLAVLCADSATARLVGAGA